MLRPHRGRPLAQGGDGQAAEVVRTLQTRALAAEADASYKQPVPDTPTATVEKVPAASRRSLTRFAWLSIAAALLTIGLKTVAYLLTGSVGLLSDAIESFVNLVGAIMALAMLTVAARPADEDHAFGHGKAEYFSSGVEGTLILIAAVSIAIASVERLVTPKPLEQVGLGLALSVMASLVNLGVALLLLRAGRKHNSITLEADAQHLLTDVWTAVGVVVGVGAVALTGWQRLDPIVALAVAANILRTGVTIVSRSISGLMDVALSAEELGLIHKALEPYRQEGLAFHALRTRRAGASRFVTLHILVPGDWTVQRGHQLLERLEGDVRRALPDAIMFTHLEPLGDPASFSDVALERDETTRSAPALEQRSKQP
jgi:cation diffusion facilitator family transporter